MKKLGYSSQFKKDLKRVRKSGRQVDQLPLILELLQHERPIPPNFKDHRIAGRYRDRRELHLSYDLLLLYKRTATEIVLERIGTHSDLFN
ncbi:MAG: type II toxin-antitoxin system YafQ family toxin [Spirochaetaceae bacterium]|nr:type II toxin-antitoxin system YafQ family toxin [Spirochaetaceae bacterium]